TLYEGETYEETRSYKWFENSELRHNIFGVQNMIVPLSGFDFERTDQSLFNGSQTKNIRELTVGIDSLEKLSAETTSASYDPLISSFIFPYDKALATDTIPATNTWNRFRRRTIDTLGIRDRSLYAEALGNNSSRNYYCSTKHFEEALTQLYKYKVDWQKNVASRFGHDLLSDRRTAGSHHPQGWACRCCRWDSSDHYIITITGEKMAREGSWNSFSACGSPRSSCCSSPCT
ncbi:MAG: YjgP/YjgQ family permease, partial [Alistipes onderdonkii]